jgi:hypothetical protein
MSSLRRTHLKGEIRVAIFSIIEPPDLVVRGVRTVGFDWYVHDPIENLISIIKGLIQLLIGRSSIY